jgi:hypothetical protein
MTAPKILTHEIDARLVQLQRRAQSLRNGGGDWCHRELALPALVKLPDDLRGLTEMASLGR